MSNFDSDFITVKEAAAMLGLAVKTVHNRKGGTKNLRRFYFGRAVRMSKSEILEFLEDQIKKAGKPYRERKRSRFYW